MKSYYGRDTDFSVLIYLLLGGFVVLLFYKFSGLFSSNSGSSGLSNIKKEVESYTNPDMMNCGMTYNEMAISLYELLFRDSVFGWWKNTDEAAVGALVLKIMKSEFSRLSVVFGIVKRDRRPFVSFGTDDTLIEDLKSVFDKSEQQRYISHLL
jgi:hypothetical protein